MRKIIMSWIVSLCFCLNAQAQNWFSQEDSIAFEKIKDGLVRYVGFINGCDEYAQMCKKYTVKKKDSNDLRQFLIWREEGRIFYTLHYHNDINKRIKKKMELDSIFCDSIYVRLIPYNKISGENISLALRISANLKMDKAQHEYIMGKALDIAHRLDKNPTLNIWDEEMKILQQTLDEKQLYQFFKARNIKKIKSETAMYWETLVEAGLDEELDSASDCLKTYKYLQRLYMYNDIYRHNGQMRRKFTADVKQHKPPLVKMYETLMRRKREM